MPPAVSTSPPTPRHVCGSCFPNMGDHTTGTSVGNVAVRGRGCPTPTRPSGRRPRKCWRTPPMIWSFWTTSPWHGRAPAGVVASLERHRRWWTRPSSSATGQHRHSTWRNYTATINSGSATSLTLNFVDPSDTYAFNDLVIGRYQSDRPGADVDACAPEPSSLSLPRRRAGLDPAVWRSGATYG